MGDFPHIYLYSHAYNGYYLVILFIPVLGLLHPLSGATSMGMERALVVNVQDMSSSFVGEGKAGGEMKHICGCCGRFF
jgi:hypothetical protein